MDNAETIINDYEEIHNEPQSYTTKDVWDNLENLALAIKNQGYSLGDEILERIRTKRLEFGICPDCSEELTSKPEVINTMEVRGITVCETCDRLNCNSCGWSQDYDD